MEAKDLEHDWLIQSSFCRQQGFHGEHGWLIQSSFCRNKGSMAILFVGRQACGCLNMF